MSCSSVNLNHFKNLRENALASHFLEVFSKDYKLLFSIKLIQTNIFLFVGGFGFQKCPKIDCIDVRGGPKLQIFLFQLLAAAIFNNLKFVHSIFWQEYKPPASHDIPEDLRTTFYDSKRNPSGVLGSKATGEPSVLV